MCGPIKHGRGIEKMNGRVAGYKIYTVQDLQQQRNSIFERKIKIKKCEIFVAFLNVYSRTRACML